jgi:hypothetical protein
LLAHGRWFSPGTPASSTTKPGRHDIAEILLKVVLKHKNSTTKNHLHIKTIDLQKLNNKKVEKHNVMLYWETRL